MVRASRESQMIRDSARHPSDSPRAPLRHGWRALLLILTLAGSGVEARPQGYDLDPTATSIAFATDFGGAEITGTLPLAAADLTLDFERVMNCRIAVTLDAARAKANFPFAAEAMKGAEVLDTRNFPQIAFVSTKVRAAPGGASVTGDLTIRGITQPVTLSARLFRPQGSAEDDLDQLRLRLTGAISRRAFGAAGWPDLVGDEVRIRIDARIEARN